MQKSVRRLSEQSAFQWRLADLERQIETNLEGEVTAPKEALLFHLTKSYLSELLTAGQRMNAIPEYKVATIRRIETLPTLISEIASSKAAMLAKFQENRDQNNAELFEAHTFYRPFEKLEQWLKKLTCVHNQLKLSCPGVPTRFEPKYTEAQTQSDALSSAITTPPKADPVLFGSPTLAEFRRLQKHISTANLQIIEYEAKVKALEERVLALESPPQQNASPSNRSTNHSSSLIARFLNWK